ncbi:MAG: PEP-CTERM sorting domain-containing protein [Fimbriimonadaceae bacterium]|nr:PEP-CTERM sorting domain-containing protein [Fimbriimonadaceae bacterium]QYK55536.1 MAG: PEP-CTERM sorting domain-containing protein [Fimbriimonadaceae bacterium]
MKINNKLAWFGGVVALSGIAQANLLYNGNLDRRYQQEIVPGFFLPKPDGWVNEGTRTVTGAFEDESSSEPWAGPAPTPETTDGFDVTNNVADGGDWGLFFKPFTGNTANGAVTGHLYQDVAAAAGSVYTLKGWAGAEANATMEDAVLALDFLDANKNVLSSSVYSMLAELKVVNGFAFNYKEYSVSGTAPTDTAFVRARVSMINGVNASGGQAFVVDDFDLEVVPEPATMVAMGAGLLALARRRRK